MYHILFKNPLKHYWCFSIVSGPLKIFRRHCSLSLSIHSSQIVMQIFHGGVQFLTQQYRAFYEEIHSKSTEVDVGYTASSFSSSQVSSVQGWSQLPTLWSNDKVFQSMLSCISMKIWRNFWAQRKVILAIISFSLLALKYYRSIRFTWSR